MPQFRHAHSNGKDWQEVARACAEQLEGARGNLGFLYATDAVADHLHDILSLLRKKTAVPHWVGTIGLGVCATGREYLDEPAAAAMVAEFEPSTFKVFSGIAGADDVKRLDLKCGGAQAAFAIVHADPQNQEIVEVVSALASKVESGFLVGGLTSARQQNFQIADRVLDGGVSGVAFSDSVTIATRLTQGCSPIGPKHVITSGQRNIIVQLDGRPALDVFLEDIGEELARDLERIGGHVFVGLPIKGSDTGDYLVRNLVGIDPSNRLIAIGDMVEPGASVMFCRRDADTATDDMSRMLESIRPGANVMFCRRDADTATDDMSRMLESIRQGMYSPPRGAVYYSCLGRGASLFGSKSKELRMIGEALGDFPLVGFFCNGEISHNRLYGYTGVLTLFF